MPLPASPTPRRGLVEVAGAVRRCGHQGEWLSRSLVSRGVSTLPPVKCRLPRATLRVASDDHRVLTAEPQAPSTKSGARSVQRRAPSARSRVSNVCGALCARILRHAPRGRTSDSTRSQGVSRPQSSSAQRTRGGSQSALFRRSSNSPRVANFAACRAKPCSRLLARRAWRARQRSRPHSTHGAMSTSLDARGVVRTDRGASCSADSPAGIAKARTVGVSRDRPSTSFDEGDTTNRTPPATL
ncbi:MAG: hypothetical protein K0S70_1091 [Microbacterium sp.]|jgi:hypothetical protein|nr:hypothetical protein [Microbacterium sp.]